MSPAIVRCCCFAGHRSVAGQEAVHGETPQAGLTKCFANVWTQSGCGDKLVSQDTTRREFADPAERVSGDAFYFVKHTALAVLCGWFSKIVARGHTLTEENYVNLLLL